MTTGKTPFKADTAEGFIRKHLFEKPLPPSKANPSIPPACEKIILKCLEKKKEDRYKTVEELLQDLEIQKKQSHVPDAWPRMKTRQRILTASTLTLLLGVMIYGFYRLIINPIPPPARERNLIAVMYAENNSGDKRLNDQLRWVIPNLLGTALAQSKYLSVLPQDRLRTILSDMKQMDEEHHLSKTLDRIADAAAVQYFVLPGFTKVGDNFWISFLVRKAKSDATLGEPGIVKGKSVEDLLAMVDELSVKVKSGLSLSPADIAGDSNQKLQEITTGSLKAVRYYIDAEKSFIEGDFRGSIKTLEKAVHEDPDYARAYQLMAENYNDLGEYDKNMLYLRKALALVDHVSEKDRLIIQEYAAIDLDESPLQAMEFSKKLIALDPKDQDSYIKLGVIWRNLEEWDLALEQFDKTLMINPENSIALENKLYIYAAMGRYREASELCEAHAKIRLRDAYFLKRLALLYLCQGRYDQASAELEKAFACAPDDLYVLQLKGHLHHLNGDLESARQFYEQLRRRGRGNHRCL